MQLRNRLLQCLSDGEFHSGEALGASLGISRMAVWKHLRGLREAGLDFEVVRGKGYRLSRPRELLDAGQVRSAVCPETRAALGRIDVFHQLDSTSNWLRERALAGADSGSVCMSEMQHSGRGRHGRQWVSPFAANLYLSLLWRTEAGAAALGGLSLVTGIGLMRCLRGMGIRQAGLKWPNDILVDGAKLAGILIDVTGEVGGDCAVVIGIGINVDMPPTAAAGIGRDWTDLCSVTGGDSPSRNRLAATLLDELLPALDTFESGGLGPFMDEWREHDVLAGQPIDLLLPDRTVSGRACGIDDGGALLMDTAAGRKRFAAGEASLRVVT
ncbi:MAG: bifunctional biotin--[acetyl-CoA-carboxylase] ligase/biotin operon repressor BirA [Gammaproteobacteria bacterium]|nr:bifunctional biotin--[acetyl-CoA-carboxylase] ligase/biotin operon repressor BirA [Gammaproteobacteria bacterium]